MSRFNISDTKCQKYDSLYRVENYMLLAWYCKVNTKFNSSRKATTAGIFCSHTLSVWIARETMLLMTISIHFGATILISSGMLTRLLRYTLNELTIVL